MLRKTSQVLCLISVALMLVPSTSIQAQENEQIIVVSPKVGEVIDRQERDAYSIFLAAQNFQSAVILQRPDSTYVAEITEGVSGAEQVRNLPIDQRTLDRLRDQIEQYHLDPSRQFRLSPGAQRKGPLIHIETTCGRQVRGLLEKSSGDSIIFVHNIEHSWPKRQATTQRVTNIHLNDISYLSLPRKSRLSKGVLVGLGFGAMGAFLGLASGDDPPGWWSFTAEQKAVALGFFLGAIGISIGGSLGALKSVDIDIPWEGKTEAQKRAILSQVAARQYRSRPFFKVSPWVGAISGPHGKVAAVFGGRLRYHFTPRSGFELNYGETRWFSSGSRYSQYYDSFRLETERSKISYISGGFFIFPIRKRSVTPFVAWGWGMTKTRAHSKTRWENDYTDKDFSIHFSGGVEIPLTRYISLEGSLEEILRFGKEDYGNIQLALNFGPNF